MNANLADSLATLPTKSTPASPQDLQAVTAVFGQQPTAMKKYINIILIGIIVFVVSLPVVGEFITTKFGCTPYMTAIVKAIIAIVLYWTARKFYLKKP